SYGGVQMGQLEKNVSWISLFIAIAPMLGFMGTVIGMIEAFDKTKHKITKKDQGSYDQLIIDGKEIYGIEIYGGDDSLPEDHYKSITVTMKGKNVSIPKSAYDDLYQIFYFNRLIYYDEEAEALYIFANNGDAGLAYQVCWQIVKDKYITRIIGLPL
ncbi:MAG: MotA/TolQ/ExbB proton channel family protein, partial [Capnocytophaga granulosa]